jgi:hypothetical protein
MSPDRQLCALAAAQHSCFTVSQALGCGLTARQVRGRTDIGRYERLGPRVLRLAGSAPTWEQSLFAGLLDLGGHTVVSHRAAAALYEFDGFDAGPVEFTVERRRHGIRSPWVVHTTRVLGLADRADVGRFPCTSASRTVIDLAARSGVSEVERAMDSAVRAGLTSPAFLQRRLSALRGRGRSGVRLLDSLLPDAGGHSPLEREFLALVRKAGLPRPRCQVVYKHDGKTIARVDCDFAPRPVVVEVSGRRGHASDAERAKDARRRNELQALGLIVLEFTTDDIHRRPDYVLAMLRRHLLP